MFKIGTEYDADRDEIVLYAVIDEGNYAVRVQSADASYKQREIMAEMLENLSRKMGHGITDEPALK